MSTYRPLRRPVDREVPLVEVDLRNRPSVEHRESFRVVLVWWEPDPIHAELSEFVSIALDERHDEQTNRVPVGQRRRIGAPRLRYLVLGGTVPMMNRRSSQLLLIVGVIAFAVAACSPSTDAPQSDLYKEDNGPSAAEIAPIFFVGTTDGGSFSLSDHLANDGRPLFLNLWASWCFPCREEMPAIDSAAAAHPEIAFVGVSVQDSTEDAIAFAEEIGVSYTIGFDENDSVDDSYRPLGLPASYLISSDGVIVDRIFGKVTQEMLDEKFATYFE